MKVIDLLNKMANGENVPKEIEVDKKRYTYDILEFFYKMEDTGDDLLELCTVYSSYLLLNKEATIIEEDEDINIQDIEELEYVEDYEADKTDIRLNRDKINELIKAVKELDRRIK